MSSTSPFRTSSDLILLTLKRLGVLADGQTVDTDDFNSINEDLDSIFRKIAGLEIAYVPDPQNIPGAWLSDLADIMAGENATKFGLVGQELADKVIKGLGGMGGIEIGGGVAAKSLKIMTRGRPTYEPLRFMNY